MKKTLCLWLCILAMSFLVYGQSGQYTSTTPYGLRFNPSSCQSNAHPKCSDQGTVTISGNYLFFDSNGGTKLTVGYQIVSSTPPSTMSIVLIGYDSLGNATTINTYSTVANATIFPTLSGAFDHFKITPTWTGGVGVSVNVAILNTIGN